VNEWVCLFFENELLDLQNPFYVIVGLAADRYRVGNLSNTVGSMDLMSVLQCLGELLTAWTQPGLGLDCNRACFE
jgi:hypothetical protein